MAARWSASIAEGAGREALVQAATKEFTLHGFHGARVDRIASSAGINKQLIYYYFGGKRELYEAVLGRVVGMIPLDSDLPDNLRSTMEIYELGATAFRAAAGAEWIRIIMWEALDYDGGEIVQAAERAARYTAFITDVANAKDRGELDPEFDPTMIAVVLAGLMQFPAMLPHLAKLLTGLSPAEPEFQERYDRTVRQLLASLEPRAAPQSAMES